MNSPIAFYSEDRYIRTYRQAWDADRGYQAWLFANLWQGKFNVIDVNGTLFCQVVIPR